jgi:hypothetical protein
MMCRSLDTINLVCQNASDTQKYMERWYERAVDEQRAELRVYKKRAKSQTQLPQVEPVPLTIEEDLSQGQARSDRSEPIKA